MAKTCSECDKDISHLQGKTLTCSPLCYSRRHTRIRRAWLREQKHMKPCFDCGVSYPYYVMQYDHVPERGEKLFELNRHGGNRSLKMVQMEIAKCDLVCANCHAERSYKRLGLGQ